MSQSKFIKEHPFLIERRMICDSRAKRSDDRAYALPCPPLAMPMKETKGKVCYIHRIALETCLDYYLYCNVTWWCEKCIPYEISTLWKFYLIQDC